MRRKLKGMRVGLKNCKVSEGKGSRQETKTCIQLEGRD